MRNEETEDQQLRTAGYITIPMTVLDGWVGHSDRYLKWWTWLRREASWTEREVWFNRQQVYLQARQVIVTVNLLVKQWNVSKPTVIRFLQRLEQDKLIERQTDNHKSIITITQLGWADLEVKSEVKDAVNIDSEVDRQMYPQVNLTPFIDKEINIIAGGGARTREEAAKPIKSEELRIKSDNDSFDEVVDFFNEQMKGKAIPQVALKTPERRQAYEQLIAQTGVDKKSVKQAIMNAAASDFLNGKGQKGWIADFDWIMVPQHFQKVLENFYRNKQVTQTYGTTNGYQDPRRGVEASRTDSFAAGYDRPL